jgi:hypothetical protein
MLFCNKVFRGDNRVGASLVNPPNRPLIIETPSGAGSAEGVSIDPHFIDEGAYYVMTRDKPRSSGIGSRVNIGPLELGRKQDMVSAPGLSLPAPQPFAIYRLFPN